MNLLRNQNDQEIFDLIAQEAQRQEKHIELIASENYVSPAVLKAQGSILTNKYAEGYPNKRYYGGCSIVDQIEQIAIDRLCELFGAKFANVQPHSGSQANTAAYAALLSPGDTILGMSLAHGGHLTHGASVSFSGKVYKAVQYGTDDAGMVDYDEVLKIAQECKPKLLVAGFSAYSRQMDWAKMREIADTVDAYLMVDMAHVAGLIAAGIYPNPLPYAHIVTSTTHKTLAGPRGGIILTNDEEIAKKINFAVFPQNQGGPLLHIIAAKAVCFKEALTDEFKAYQQQVLNNARAMANVFIKRNFKVISGGTDCHLFLVDLQNKNITGKEAEALLEKAHITLNKNSVPNDPQSPFITSGIRIGTPAITRRGFKEAETIKLAQIICDLLEHKTTVEEAQKQVTTLIEGFNVY